MKYSKVFKNLLRKKILDVSITLHTIRDMRVVQKNENIQGFTRILGNSKLLGRKSYRAMKHFSVRLR